MTENRTPPVAGDPAPAPATRRIVSLDALRGVGVLGILVMNVYAFSMPFAAYGNPLVMGGTDVLNLGTWFVTHVFFDLKFMTIFAMMFGAGMIMMMQRAEARGARFGPIYYRRLFWLLVIGAVHGYLIWFGDILFMYAVVGMIVFLFRRRSARTLIVVACALLPIGMLASFGASYYIEDMQQRVANIEVMLAEGGTPDEEQQRTLEEWEASRPFMAPTDSDIRNDVEAYRGGYAEIVAHRAPVVAMMQTEGVLSFGLWRVGAMMLIGMALMKLGALTGERSPGFYRKLMWAGYGLGLPLTVFSAVNLYAHEFESIYVWRYGMFANYVGSVLVALGHIGLVMWFATTGRWQALLTRFAAVGRMALSNYLMHSLILTSVFYGYGLGLYGNVPRFGQMGFVAAVLALQLLLSPWWLARFRFGPVEWLWRSVTYWRWQGLRIQRV